MGGTGPADAAIETFVPYLAAEVGPHGVRVVGLWTAGVPETLTREKPRSVGGRRDSRRRVGLRAEDLVQETSGSHPWCYDGIDALTPLLERAFGQESPGEWRLVPTSANRQPAAASYLLAPGDTTYRAFKLDVLRIEDGKVAEVTTFDARLFPASGFPPTLS